MIINFTPGAGFGQTSGSAPAGLLPAAEYVANLYDAIFTNPITLNITLNWAVQQQGVLASNNIFSSVVSGTTVSYSALLTALTAHEQGALQSSTWNALPATDPTTGSGTDFYLTPGQAEIFGANGYSPANPISGFVTVTSQNSPPPTPSGYPSFGPLTPVNWSFTPGLVLPGQNYAIAAVTHETTETMMGRYSINGQGGQWTLLDLFRYTSASGSPQPDLIFTSSGSTANTTAYFSLNGGTTNLGTWNNHWQRRLRFG